MTCRIVTSLKPNIEFPGNRMALRDSPVCEHDLDMPGPCMLLCVWGKANKVQFVGVVAVDDSARVVASALPLATNSSLPLQTPEVH